MKRHMHVECHSLHTLFTAIIITTTATAVAAVTACQTGTTEHALTHTHRNNLDTAGISIHSITKNTHAHTHTGTERTH